MASISISRSYSVTPRIRCARCLPVIRCRCHVIFLHVAFCHVIICISSTCFSKLASVRVPPVLSVVRSELRHTHTLPSHLSDLVSRAGEKCSRNGMKLGMRCCFRVGRPPVKFRAIWSPFDTPTVNRGTVKASCVLQPNTPPKWPNNPSKPPPSSRSFDHDRVAENRTSFGLS